MKFPDWIEQVEAAFKLWQERKTKRQILDELAGTFKLTSGMSKIIDRFEKDETAEMITAGIRAYRASRQ